MLQGPSPESSGGDPSAPLVFVAITPCRMMDTRGFDPTFTGVYGPPSIAASGSRTLPVAGVTAGYCSVPSTAQAVSVNITLWPTPGSPVSYLTIWPAGQSFPAVSTLNDQEGVQGVNNGAIAVLGTGGAFDVFVTNLTDLFIDVNGYYASPTDPNGNTAIGAGALANITTGYANTASGDAALASDTTGGNNTAIGNGALQDNTTGNYNTASGTGALGFNTNGGNNTATGFGALAFNTTGNNNTGSGANALGENATGNGNTASGSGALALNSTGSNNTALGANALQNSTTASNNTAVGQFSLANNTTGCCNTASGQAALFSNSTGVNNTATGQNALYNDTGGNGNTATGYGALFNTTGFQNTAVGINALNSNTSGTVNIGIGAGAGHDAPAGNSNSIYIGSQGTATDAGGTIQIGTEGTQTGGTFIAGVFGATTSSGSEVFVDSNGQLGTVSSSRRFKEQINDMGDSSSKLLQLRPVTFVYKPEYDDGSHLLQYGLVAEEVATIYPEMVVHDKNGQIQTVKYQFLAPMLLNELQKQRAEVEKQNQRAQQQDETIRQLQARLAALEESLGMVPTAAATGR